MNYDHARRDDPGIATITDACPECGGRLANDEAHAEVRCVECGLVVEADEIDPGPEWRAFDARETNEKSRVGAPTTKLMHDDGLSTLIGRGDVDAHGNPLDPGRRRQMQRLRTWNERFRTRDALERNLQQALGEVDRMASALGLPDDVRETAGVVYRRALDDDLVVGRSIEGVATAALYAATRMTAAPRTLDDMAAVSRVPRLEISRTYRYLDRELALRVEPPDPVAFVPRIASTVDASERTQRRARDLLERTKGGGLHSGKSPPGLAAAAVYAAAILTDEDLTQNDVSEAGDVSNVTIRNNYTELLDATGYTGRT